MLTNNPEYNEYLEEIFPLIKDDEEMLIRIIIEERVAWGWSLSYDVWGSGWMDAVVQQELDDKIDATMTGAERTMYELRKRPAEPNPLNPRDYDDRYIDDDDDSAIATNIMLDIENGVWDE